MTLKELETYLGATSLGYLSVEGAMDAVGRPRNTFCTACFSGDYPVAVPDDLTKDAFEGSSEVGEIAAISHTQLKLIEI
jgi:amidophosphoribosyltransferase